MTTQNELHQTAYRCPECSSIMRDIHGELVFAYEGHTITVTDVPMRHCRNCGERLVAGPIGISVSELVSEVHELLQHSDEMNGNRIAPTDAITIHYAARDRQDTFAIA